MSSIFLDSEPLAIILRMHLVQNLTCPKAAFLKMTNTNVMRKKIQLTKTACHNQPSLIAKRLVNKEV